ncbi:MAG: methyltransferase domain-containing protein [Pleurocapsa sp.]
MSKTERLVYQEYNRLAPIYDSRWRNYLDRSLSFLLDFADISSQASILDLACGTGELARFILEKNPQQNITGVDISPTMLKIAQDKLEDYFQVKLFNTSATALPFDSQSFDLIICANAFHYFENPSVALAEIKRVLKPNGKLIILDWSGDYWVLKLLNPLFKFIDPAYQQCYKQKKLAILLVNADFYPVEASKVRFSFIWELIAISSCAKLIK